MPTPAARRLPLACIAASVAVLTTISCTPRAVEFDEVRARAHILTLAGTIGIRPAGSRAGAEARAYLVGELRRAGFSVRVQQVESHDPLRGVTVPVANIIAVRDGAVRDALALIAHYDSAPDAPGALDDALGVAVCLEAGRVLAGSGLRHSLMVILTDGEELGLMGARAAVADGEIAARVRAFLNFDGTGAAGPALLFQATPGAATRAWAEAAAAPEGGSFSSEIYTRMPNDTDFTIFAGLGAAGLNFAPVGDSYAYHTDRDVPARVQSFTLRHSLANTIAIARAADTTMAGPAPDESERRATTGTYTLGRPEDGVSFFDLAGRRGVTYGPRATAVIAWTAIALGALVWLRLTRDCWRARGLAGMVSSVAWAVAGTGAAAGTSVGVAWALRALRGELNPWYASPAPFFTAAFSGGVAAFLGFRLLAARLAGHRSPASPAATWWLTLPVWMALALLLQVSAPFASYLVTLPLLASSLLLILTAGNPGRIRLASSLMFVVCGAIWLEDTLRLLSFVVPLFGWLPIVPPVWIYSALMVIGAGFCAPPLAAMIAGVPARVTAAGALLFTAISAAAFVVAARAPAYTADRPERRIVRYVQDDGVQPGAWWEVSGLERRIDVRAGAPDPALWAAAAEPIATTVRVPALRAPFAFRTAVAPIAPAPPAIVESVIAAPANGRVELTVTITPREQLAATLILPHGVTPRSSSLPGVVLDRRWRATYVGPSPAGIAFRADLDEAHAASLDETIVVLSTYTVPGTAPGDRVPLWLPSETATWQPRALYIVRAAPHGGPPREAPRE